MKQLTPRQQAILAILADGNFHSGEQLGVQLGISRAAISQQMKFLRELGLDIFSITGKGYCLKDAMQFLEPAVLDSLNGTGAPIHVCAMIDSTNQYMMSQLTSWQRGECVLAEMQTAGRGRRGRVWQSPFGGQYIMSMYWRMDAGPVAAMGMSLAVGIAIVDALEQMGYQDLGLKWPNDIYMGGRKLAGILVEMSASVGEACHIVIGAGINLKLPEDIIARLDQPCAHLAEQAEINIPRNELTYRIIASLREKLTQFERQGLRSFLPDWNRFDIFHGRRVNVICGDEIISGTYLGINSEGNMRLMNDSGEEQIFVGGEVSLRPQV